MRRGLLLSLLICMSAFYSSAYGSSNYGYDFGLSVAEMRSFSSTLKNLSGRIQSLVIFTSYNGRKSVAVSTMNVSSQWQLYVYTMDVNHVFTRQWASGILPFSFDVADPLALKVFNLSNETAITFSGCAEHDCDDVFSYLLYVPSEGKYFTATNYDGQITYSKNLQSQGSRKYKAVLDQLVEEQWKTTAH